MRNKNLVQKIVLIALAIAVLIALVAPAIFSQTLPAPKQEKLLNGLKVLMWSDARADKATVAIRIHAGSAFDPQGKEGVMQMLADNLFPNEAAREFFTEDLGGGLEIITNYDFIQINASAKPDQFLPMLETLAAAVSNMAIDKETTDKLRNIRIAKLSSMEADAAYVADQAVAKQLFGTFPYGRPQYGTTDSLRKIDFADLIDAKQRFLTADNATIAISGNFDRALGFRAVRRYFGGWLKSDKRVPATFRQPEEPVSVFTTVLSPAEGTTVFRFAMRGSARGDKDLGASLVFASILENRLLSSIAPPTGRDVSVTNGYHVLPGMLSIGFTAVKDNGRWPIGKAEATALVGKLLGDPVTESEYQNAKQAIAGLWAKKDPHSFWLDADTYKIASPDANARIVETTTLADVKVHAEKARKLSIAKVLVAKEPLAD
ncbi:MAG TPA: pitrilysin family protein [Pyrinomonadaceae bacterium]|nr:pitrilysin family protein [Pyrinomonadaceae bacterium]